MIILPSCISTKRQNVKNKFPIKEIIINRELRPDDEPDFSIENASIKDSTFIILVNYPGGKGFYNFDLVFNGLYQKSLPLQVNLFLKHDIENETRKKLISRELKFNISKLKRENYKTIIIKLYSYPEELIFNY